MPSLAVWSNPSNPMTSGGAALSSRSFYLSMAALTPAGWEVVFLPSARWRVRRMIEHQRIDEHCVESGGVGASLVQAAAETLRSPLGGWPVRLVSRRMPRQVTVAFAPSVDSVSSPISDAVRVIVTPNDFQHRHFPENFTKKELRRRNSLYDAAMARADLIISGSQQTLRDIERFYPENAQLARVLPFPAPADLRPPSPAESRFVEDILGPAPGPTILYPAQLWPHKNHMVLVRAVQHLRQRGYSPVKLVLTGEGPCGNRIRAAVQRLDLQRFVTMCGNVTRGQLFALFQAADVVAVPSLFEQASYPLMEAGWFDKPVLAADIPCLREDLKAFPSALLPPSEPKGWADSLLRAFTDSDHRAHLVQAGRAVYARHDPTTSTLGFWDGVLEVTSHA
jgi:glycosyltransferase involved in cell wall biosynthesis